MTPSREIELKFELDAAGLGAVLAALPQGDEAEKSLHAIYYDTSDRALSSRGFGLRVRRSGESFTQTLKSELGADGGRDEWEWPVAGFIPDLALLVSTPAALPDGVDVSPLFTVTARRRQRVVQEGDAEIEIALDEATVTAGAHETAFIELELELKTGDPAALFVLARRLVEIAPLSLSFLTKAGRGFALLRDGPIERPHFSPPALSRDLSAGAAVEAIGRACLMQIAANRAALRRVPGPEGVHQLRVATRRLRSTLSTFKAVVADQELEALKTELKWLAGELDEARNLDVFIGDIWRPEAREHHDRDGMAAFGKALLSAQTTAYQRVAAAIESTRFNRLMLTAAAWLQAGPWTQDDAPNAPLRDGGARVFAAEALRRRRRKILKDGKALRKLDAEPRHQLRIQAKKLRYAAEDLAPLFGHHRRQARFIAGVKALQDSLGALNDLAFSTNLAAGVAVGAGLPEAAWAAGRLAGERAVREADLLDEAARAYDGFKAAKPFW